MAVDEKLRPFFFRVFRGSQCFPMNHRTDPNCLLAEVLAEASPADFRAALLAETLRLARRRRLFRQARRVAGVLAVISLLAVMAGQQFSKPKAIVPARARPVAPPVYQLVCTRPLSAGAFVSTRKFSNTQSAAPVAGVAEIATVSGGYRMINDDELLALLADKPAVLIRTGPQTEELVFANPEDQKKLLAN
jgi:hypothetical protein